MALSDLVLLDTNILVRMIRNDPVGKQVEVDHELSSRTERPLISIVTVGEIRSLARKFGWGTAKRKALEALLRQLVQVNLNQGDILDRYAEIDYYTRSALKPARPMGQNDMWIAATASAVDAQLFTTDHDFDPLDPRFLKLVKIDAITGKTRSVT
jgi:tRNA(fMet)-specific endonuclease VapC